MKTENLFSDETLLSDLGEPIPMESDSFDFLNMTTANDFDERHMMEPLRNTNVVVMPTSAQQQAPRQPPPAETAPPVQTPPRRISVAQPAQTVFSSQYTIPQTMNFNVQSPVVTLAPLATPQRQLLLPAKLIKSESVVYSRGAQAITSTPVPHQIHTLVNTTNGTVLATGKTFYCWGDTEHYLYFVFILLIFSSICRILKDFKD